MIKFGLVVDGILTSCYAYYDHHLAHMALTPVRVLPWLLEDKRSQHKDGLRNLIWLLTEIGSILGFQTQDTEMVPMKHALVNKVTNHLSENNFKQNKL